MYLIGRTLRPGRSHHHTKSLVCRALMAGQPVSAEPYLPFRSCVKRHATFTPPPLPLPLPILNTNNPTTTTTMAGPTVPAQLSRRRPIPTGDEEATAILKLGEMTDVPTLSVAECNELLARLSERSGRPPSSSEVYSKTREYVALFARFKDGKTVTQVDAISSRLLNMGLAITNFERAQLGMSRDNISLRGHSVMDWVADDGFRTATLCCDTAEEARTLIPSLEGKISDDELQQVLDDISKLRDFS